MYQNMKLGFHMHVHTQKNTYMMCNNPAVHCDYALLSLVNKELFYSQEGKDWVREALQGDAEKKKGRV